MSDDRRPPFSGAVSPVSADAREPSPSREASSSTSPARPEIERALILLAALQQEFDATWFDHAMFVERVDPMIEAVEQVLRVIQVKDPDYDAVPLQTRLWRYVMQRLRG